MCRIAIGNGKGILNPIKLPLEEGFVSICDKLAEKPVVELKEVLGESRAAAATTAAAHAALMFAGKIPSQEAYSIAADGSVSKTNVEASKLNNVLVVAYGAGGSYTAIVLSK